MKTKEIRKVKVLPTVEVYASSYTPTHRNPYAERSGNRVEGSAWVDDGSRNRARVNSDYNG